MKLNSTLQISSFFGSRFLKRVESSRLLTQVKHGDRSGHTPLEVVVFISMFFYYIIPTIINAVLGSYDAEN